MKNKKLKQWKKIVEDLTGKNSQYSKELSARMRRKEKKRKESEK